MSPADPVICEVGPRDGLQNADGVLSPAIRAELCRRLAAAGLPAVEAVSFVRDDRVPQMAGAEEVVAGLAGAGGETVFSGLVLNRRGAERLLACGLEELHLAVMATDGFSQRNTGMDVADALAQAAEVIELAHAGGVRVLATVSVAFGCPVEGPVAPAAALRIAEALAAAGADGLVLADTIGVATPRSVRALVAETARLGDGLRVGVHLHDTRNTAMAGSLAALEAGAVHLESSVGGLGGCPFAPGAAGNLATEDLVYAMEQEGVRTGVDLDAVLDAGRWLARTRGCEATSALQRAGRWGPAPTLASAQ